MSVGVGEGDGVGSGVAVGVGVGDGVGDGVGWQAIDKRTARLDTPRSNLKARPIANIIVQFPV